MEETAPVVCVLCLHSRCATGETKASWLFKELPIHSGHRATYQSSFSSKQQQKRVDELFRFVLPFLNKILPLFANVGYDLLALVLEFVHFVLKAEFLLLFIRMC